ncbi:hypothetical protein Lesp02_49440 [Lentzea sp. NBRC 105346]|uniref:YcxB family protein n=1 Tax=Lentzea sp. NBRC 105346 TaxID=3032205 RepID=UPI0024A37D94|nr:YcxB family protein [Lentzea sp. NBRC 105346]GLZ32756.1 hypothetical protein Lesp02_49440 [Lentzea sp. NBRC 105346]
MDRATFKVVVDAPLGRHFRRYRLIGAILIPMFLLGVIFSPRPEYILAVVVGVFALLTPTLMHALSYRNLKRLPQVPWTYHLTAEGFEIGSPTGTSKRDWSMVKAVRETDDAWVFESEVKGCTVGLPKKFFTDQQHAEMRMFFWDRGMVTAG